ncbi:protein tyrosine phosphatase family protein [Sabulicella rubraurantiaca]|uniref:beta-lactamase hydrolase domain-containing protein n=1 Tax=Sabulicella rubraurantiaca TaxID=2811429 RepID=UPI001A962C81|nr:protein tyrosine phosphatase family protein [Sabulicella rubraurantiaca]
MGQRFKINDKMTIVTDQPSEEELKGLSKEGFKAVVNLRSDGEQNQPLPPAAEGEVVRSTGLKYAHVPVVATAPSHEQVDRFREAVSGMEGPVLVHCASGKRAGAFAILQVAKEEGLSGEEALARAKSLGMDWKSPELENFVRQNLDGRK